MNIAQNGLPKGISQILKFWHIHSSPACVPDQYISSLHFLQAPAHKYAESFPELPYRQQNISRTNT